MNKNNFSFDYIFILSIACFVLIALLFQPGHLDILTPSHSDLYRYFLISQELWGSNWLYPRPLMLAYLKLAGLFGNPNLLFAAIAIPALIFLSLVVWGIKKIGLVQGGLLPIVAFFIVVFGSPLFYPHFQLDYGGMLGGAFAVLAVVSGWQAINGASGKTYWWLAPLFFILLSVESKPNYSFALLCLAFAAAIIVPGRRSKWLLICAVSVLVWVFLKDKFIGSPFVALSGADSPYAVIFDPLKNIKALIFYLKNAFTLPLLIAVLVAGATLILERKIKLLAILFALTVAASLPMAIIPNRLSDTYAWYSTVLLGILIMIATDLIINKRTGSLKGYLLTILLLVMMFSLLAHALSSHPTVQWTLKNQRYNANVLSNLKQIKNEGKSKILLAGLQGPYHPLKNTKFIRMVYPELRSYDVLLRDSERPWNQMSREQTNGLYRNEIDFGAYTYVYVFDSDGYLLDALKPNELLKLERADLDLLLMCGKYEFKDPVNYARAIECLNSNGLYDSAIGLGRSAVKFGDAQPWIYFHLAKSYIAGSQKQKAKELLLQALAKDPGNSLFKSTLAEIQK